MGKFNLKTLNEVVHKEEYCVEISKRFTVMENLDAEVDVNKAKIGIYKTIILPLHKRLGSS
jgi:hypothetical protein